MIERFLKLMGRAIWALPFGYYNVDKFSKLTGVVKMRDKCKTAL